MQPFLAVATLVAALGVVAVNSETAYILAPVQHGHQNPHRVQRVLNSGWGWKPVRQYTLSLPSISSGWGWKKQRPSLQLGVYGGIRIGRPKQQGWGHQGGHHQQHGGWGWQPQKQHGWGWQPKQQHGWGWQPKQQHGWGWDGDDDDDEDDYRSTVPEIAYDDAEEDDADSSEEAADDENSASVESDEEADDYSAEADDAPIDFRNAISYEPIY